MHPRVELRQTNGSNNDYNWSGASSTLHSLTVDYTINHLPAVTKRVVVMQIFDDDNGPWFEVFAEESQMYYYLFSVDGNSHSRVTIYSGSMMHHKFQLHAKV